MAFKGLFIGIDRYASPGIEWLSCSGRDAMALHALFTDTLGGDTTLLMDEDATLGTIREKFENLATVDQDDVVVILFSGHGTETHELVTYDTEPFNLANTTLSLTTLGEWCARIPARRLLIILDCCFSGGMGAKAIQIEIRPRDIQSVDAKLNEISGTGRIILTASGPTEKAWEIIRLGHSLLTWRLLEALQGPVEIRQGDRLGVLALLDYVTRRVVDDARLYGHEQHPAVRGTFEGEFTWPVLSPGPIFRAAFPEHANPIASADLQSLVDFGFPADVVQAWASEIPALNQLQLDAINDYGTCPRSGYYKPCRLDLSVLDSFLTLKHECAVAPAQFSGEPLHADHRGEFTVTLDL